METGFPLPVRLFFSFLRLSVTVSLSNQVPYSHPRGFFCRALRFPDLKSYRSPDGLALLPSQSLFLFSSRPHGPGIFLGLRLRILRICAGPQSFLLSLKPSHAVSLVLGHCIFRFKAVRLGMKPSVLRLQIYSPAFLSFISFILRLRIHYLLSLGPGRLSFSLWICCSVFLGLGPLISASGSALLCPSEL